MAGLSNARIAVVVAKTVDRFIGKFDFAALDDGRREGALREIAGLRANFGEKSLLIDSAFAKLERALRQRGNSPVRPNPLAARKLARMLRALTPLAMVSTALSSFVASPAMADLPVYTVNQDIVNPATGGTETVAQLLGNYAVVTSQGNFILLAQSVGDTFSVGDTDYEVTDSTPVDGKLTQVTVKNLSADGTPTSVIDTTAAYGDAPPLGGGTGTGGDLSVSDTAGEPYIVIRGGGDGGDGRDGGGVCFGALGCIEYAPGDGGSGGTHDAFTETVAGSHGEIDTSGDDKAGIVVANKGGDGGDGGFGVGNIPPAKGGNGGNGGTVTATNQTIVKTGGTDSYGMLVQSVGGRSGSGGDCYVGCSGGGPGTPGDGGFATGINEGSITTGGEGAAGLIVQSSGGNSGTGGSSYGIVGDAGSGGYGGNGGEAHAVNNGFIHTTGDSAYGVLAQSIGGIGGDSGNSAGIVAFGGDGGGGGHGGYAWAELGSSSITTTEGNWSHAVFAQSIGGGGGSTGWSGGVASFGSGGGDGGYGGDVQVTAAAGAHVETFGQGAYGIYAESVGGTGGTAGGTGGIFTMGGSGGSGKTGGSVTVDSSATIITHETDARGIFAQSVGGGGGSANASGGVVSLGGSGGSGSDGGQVTVTLGSASSIDTAGLGADGVVAQSVGGGGGSGAASGGIVALGGTGSTGGIGKLVTVTNAGTIETGGRLARGIFAQSVGGGGGSGGDGGGLVAIGGSSSSGGNGGDVILGNSGTITTGGAFSQGMFAQSIGGGGGSGGDAGGLAAIGGSGSGGGLGGDVTVSNSGLVTTGGNMSSAIQAQSIGGGGGDGGSTGGMVAIGGTAGAGNDAGTVTANISGGMETTGDDSHGLFAQSVGGGGGNGGSSVGVGLFAGVALGGSGGAGGAGGTVDVNLTSQTVSVDGVGTTVLPTISTTGDRSRGIFAQSVGGGGGSGGFSVAASVGAFFSASVAIGGSGGAGSQGGDVTLDGDVNVFTTGDNSQGIFAQSVGGGGGAGGFAVSAAASAGEGFSGSIAVGIGGTGGSGGYGGSVSGDSGGSISTTGTYSTGYLAQSVGGGGGAGGFSVAASGAVSDGLTVSASIGLAGDGGGGGNGGTVDVAFDGNIDTGNIDGSGSDSAGFIAQSIGGGGGTGGFNVSATVGLSGGGSIGGAIGLGGSGGGGGNGGTVTGRVGSVTTTGDRSTGVLVQSLGGGGGSGGFNVSGSLTGSGAFAGGISVGLGGSGSGGGDGGTVTGTVTGQTRTSGDQSDAVVIQSLGGGGGSGGFNVSGNIGLSGTASGGISVGLGGSGGTGGDGGKVTGHVQDDVFTTGNQSRGVLVQSAGGGGGGGAFNISGNLEVAGTASGSVGVGLGGSGGDGGDALDVTADAKNIYTEGDDSAGFIAQSIGGGGGAGGFNVTGGLSFSGTVAGSIGVGLGGSGGGGGNASTVDATVVGDVITQGDHSGAILAQSVGGGGGSGGFNVSGDIAGAGTGAVSVGVGLGGTGGTAGNALGVTLNVTGFAQTGTGTADGDHGAYSDGIVAQSIGGGGGDGGFNVTGNIAAAGTGAGQVGVGIGGHGGGGGSAGAVTLNVNDGVTTSDLTRAASITQQDFSAGIIAQSVGGGGGNGGFNVTGGMSFGGDGAGGINVGIGGSGGSGNSAGAVTADISGFTRTWGDDSLGVLAQSVGGGGGNGGFDVAGGLTFASDGSGSVNVGIGGSGGTGGSGDAVTLRINDQIATPDIDLVAAMTSGDRSAGVIAQSVGGGGGNGGFNVTGGVNVSGGFTGGANIGVGGKGGSGGGAKTVIADITGGIGTGGEQSGALLVQSVGGGGGNGGFNVTGGIAVAADGGGQIGVGVGGFGGDGGSGGDVTLDFNQRTEDPDNTLIAASTLGDDSGAVVVQSLGGGGGNGGFNVTGNVSLSTGAAGNIGVGVGGFGGDGGSSGVVTSSIAGDIGTSGVNSNAVLVQSAGGGGGNGGFNVTGDLALTTEGAAGNIGVGLGGFGGSGGAGNAVDSTLVGDVTTLSDSSTGITVQSLGGGGGNGGFNVTAGLALTAEGAAGNIGVGLGGFGGDGGAAGSATSSVTGNVVTHGTDSYGLLVQSQGGGGGNGGFTVTADLALTAQGAAGNLGVGLGGFGGGGGAGGAASSTLVGDLTTLSDSSSGVTVQSLGGGGGNGGFEVTGNLALTAEGAAGNLGVGLGGFGGDGGAAGSAYNSIAGDVFTGGSDSYAVLVQSLGGGGGNGGFNVTADLSVSAEGATGNLGVGIGGFGGGGGAASSATSILTGNVTTLSDSSSGVTVQSLGGGGGNGGFNVTGGISVSAGASASGNLGVGIGGFGGDGGAGGAASNAITGDIVTRGSDSYGLLVQSQGGGGGNGGFNVTGGIALSTEGSAGNLGIGIGGFGGDGGNAGNVDSTMTGDIVTGAAGQDGDLLDSYSSSGATIQSVGGGGGNGGFNVTGNLSVTMGSSTSGDIGIGIGGFGGGGGNAGTVDATQTGDIFTRGDKSYGILVQSAGGGGGNGGFDVTGNVAVTKGSSGTVGIGIGGFGGTGGTGNAVTATLAGDVATDGDQAYGATIQSLGGAGGAGGMNVTGDMTISAGSGTSIAASVGIGGFGGGGGDAGTVTGSAAGLYQTTGSDSDGALVQSAGGGGGAGGLNVSGSIALSSGTTGSGSIGIGGFGGGGGDGNTVIFTRTGDTFTSGANSNGVTVQSIGGGGGQGGINVSGSVAATKGNAGSVGFGLGGFGGDGGNGGDVTAAVYGNVIASGLESDVTVPIYDLSDLADDALLDPSQLADLPVIGEQHIRSGGSTGILVQSVGGGGGNGGLNVTGALAVTAGGSNPTGRAAAIGIGGFGGEGGNAGKVTATVAAEDGATERAQIQGIGDNQMAFAAQSIGGGGGAGGMNISGGISTAGQLVVGIGGFGGAGGTGGDVDANVDADLFVSGNNSIGFLAQSVGGGGGAGAIDISGGIQAATKGDEPEIVFGLGGFGGAGNTSGDVTAVQHGQVMAEGQFSYGVLAQSIGGGGGAGGLNVSAAVTGAGNAAKKTSGIAISAGVGGTGGTGADAGDVDLTSDGNVFVNTVMTTATDGSVTLSGVDGAIFAPGVVAQSIGGGGGAGGMNVTGAFAPKGQPIAVGVGGTGGVGGDGGDVTLTRGYGEDGPGTIVTYGQGSHGLVAQSIGGGGGNAGFDLVLAANKSKPKNPQLGATVTVGGDGGASGDGGDVTVKHLGDIYTHGGGSDGILAQSISGGGGSGALNVTGAFLKDSSAVSLALGGSGGDGGNAGDVSVTHDGTIVTEGDDSAAIRAQSIASGGGDASAEEDVTTFFDADWPVDVAIPVGPKNEIAVGIGGVGGQGGIAGDVAVNAGGTLLTQGADSAGIHAQSIGGSGGASGTTSVSASGENQKGSQAGAISVSVGLDGGEGGIAGDVSVDSSADIGTVGDRSRGIFAQSIGGSGGSGGDASNNFENASNEMSISVGGAGGSGSHAGTVDVTQTAHVDTQGDDADGILAQSIGGGGGAGGASGTQNLQYETTDSNTLAVAVGGSGGNGAIADDVTVTNGGTITTSGDQSFGIRAQSIGGGGGVGGAIDSKKLLVKGTSNSIEFNVGGSGGEGSQAGDVSVVNEGLIYTTGLDAAAISANSIGGGGGDAGSILDLSVSAATSNTFKANIGGTGGSGGIAGDVSVINRPTGADQSGYLVTEGDGAYGIFAQSLGGSGGNSSTILSISVDGGSGSMSAGFNFGNAGGTGNLAGDVSVDNAGVIDTSGEGAHGILAQSIGGGGGNGGIVLSGSLNLTNPVAAPLLSIGGSGGDGGDAGDVTVVNSGSIVTRGDKANGIVAQSIGGGGGNAGVALAVTGEPGSMIIGNTLAAALGGTTMTGTGGEGGTVTVTHTGDITVLGEGSQAIVAQSINGGGGTLSLDLGQVAAIFDEDDDGPTSAQAPDPLVVARSGGTDSTGMAGGKVTVNSTGTIGVGGSGGVAINLQSIGGGGGIMVLHGSLVAPIAGRTTTGLRTMDASTPAATPAGYDITLGGLDGSGNMGGDIGGTQQGDIVTEGANSLGLMVQSIGGGGGRAIASLDAEDLSLIAGSTVTVGGTDQANSSGGDISHVQDGTLTTLGDFSIGGLIQSVGGGGGVATVTYSQTAAPADELAPQDLTPAEVGSIATPSTVTLGASGGTGNDGGSVSETLTGGAIASGDHSAALVLQSIGAGGGTVMLSGDAFPQITLGGSAGAQGSGGDVSLTNNGAIGSLGTGGYGVVLQSIGGGGGAVFGDFGDADVSLNSANVGDGGAITFDQVGDIGALGDGSVGILAQSLGGGGGFVDGVFAGTAGGKGAGGTVTLNVDGSIIAYGADSTAVLAQSLGSLGGGNINLVSTGDIRGGSGTGIGVSFDGGADNLIDTSGTLSAVSGTAIQATTGNDTVENRGVIVGNAFLGEGTNLIHNNQGATYFTISTLDLQDGSGSGTFSNDGDVELGLRAPRFPLDLAVGDTFGVPTYDDIRTAPLYGTQVISHVALDGDYLQSSTGQIWYDVAFGPYASDRIDATGDAKVAGTAHVTLTWLENNDPVTLIATGGTGTDLGLQVPATIALNYKVLAGSAGIQLGFDSNFGQPFLNANERALGGHMDSALETGGAAGIGRLLALLGNLTAGQEDVYRDIFDELDPESLLAPMVEHLDSARDFSKGVMGCDPLQRPKLNTCVWGALQYHVQKRNSDDAAPIDVNSGGRLRLGAEVGTDGGWSLGAAFGYDSLGKLHFDGDRATGDDGEAFHAGVGVGKIFGAKDHGSVGLNLAAGWQSQTMVRRQDIFEPSFGTSRVRSRYLSADANLGYSFGNGPWFIRPNVDASAIRLTVDGFDESGLDGLGMRVDNSSDWFLAAEPKLTVGARFDRVHFALTGGGMFSNRDAVRAPMRFIGADPASDPAIIQTMVDKQAFVGGVELGIDAGKRWDLSVGYEAYLGSRTTSQTANLKLRFSF